METTQVQPCQARIETSAAGDDEIDTRVSDTGLVVVRIVKRGCAVLRHPLHLIRHALQSLNAQDGRPAPASLCDFGSWEIIQVQYITQRLNTSGNLTSPRRQANRAVPRAG